MGKSWVEFSMTILLFRRAGGHHRLLLASISL